MEKRSFRKSSQNSVWTLQILTKMVIVLWKRRKRMQRTSFKRHSKKKKMQRRNKECKRQSWKNKWVWWNWPFLHRRVRSRTYQGERPKTIKTLILIALRLVMMGFPVVRDRLTSIYLSSILVAVPVDAVPMHRYKQNAIKNSQMSKPASLKSRAGMQNREVMP